MTIDETKRFVEFIANKSPEGANPTPSEFNLLADRAFTEWVMKRYNNPHEYQPGQPIPRMAWQQTQKISDDLRFLLEIRDFGVDANGQFTIPDGTTLDFNNNTAPAYLHASTVRVKYITQNDDDSFTTREPKAKIIDSSEIPDYLSSHIVNPTNRYPLCAFYASYAQVYPKEVDRVTFEYLRQPTVPKWAFTLDANGRPIYDAPNSVDIESPDETHNEITMMILSYIGINIREPQLTQYAEALKAQGV